MGADRISLGIVAHQIPEEAITMNTFSNKLVPIGW